MGCITAFLKNSGSMNVSSNVMRVDRSKPFDTVLFLGGQRKIFEQDELALAITEVDLFKIRFEHCVKKKENFVKGEERLKRLKALGRIRLDAKVFEALWENQKLIPEGWKKLRWISFDGTIFLNPDGYHSVLCMRWRDFAWYRDCYWLECAWRRDRLSALIASIS